MSLFIDIEVSPEVANDPELAARLTEVCPVDIYAQAADGTLAIVEPNLEDVFVDATRDGGVQERAA